MPTETETTPPPSTTTPATTPPPAATKPDDLGDAGRKAIDAERSRAEKAERLAAQQADELEKLRAKNRTAEEQALADAEKKGRDGAMRDATRSLVKAKIETSAAGKFADTDVAVALAGDIERFITKTGDVDADAIKKWVDDELKARPYLAAAGTKPTALRGGSATQTTGASFNDEIRRRIFKQ